MKSFVIYSVKSLLSCAFSARLVCVIHRFLFFDKYRKLRRSRICVYTSCYGNYDNFSAPCQQTLPVDFIFFGDNPPPTCVNNLKVYVRYSKFKDPRHAAKFYKICPNDVAEIADYDITVWVDSSCLIRSRYFLEMLLMSSNEAVAMRRHPDRYTIKAEAISSQCMSKYSNMDLYSQVDGYISMGIPDDHLWHCALIVRHSSPLVSCFNKVWWLEMGKSLQDQISAPYAEYVTGLKIGVIPRWLNWFNVYTFDTSHRNHEYDG